MSIEDGHRIIIKTEHVINVICLCGEGIYTGPPLSNDLLQMKVGNHKREVSQINWVERGTWNHLGLFDYKIVELIHTDALERMQSAYRSQGWTIADTDTFVGMHIFMREHVDE